MTIDQLLAAIRTREQQEPFGRGIKTADCYVRTLQEVLGTDKCYRFFSKRQSSFDDLLKKAAKTLVYSNDEMELEDVYTKEHESLSKLDLPKNTLMVFKHVLTSSKKDRDGDILHSDGAIVDPKMLMLWQHVHTMPIGKMLQVASQNSKRLEIISCIVDMNELSHDSAVMIDNKMGRFSHGFKALKFRENKEGVGGVSTGGGEGFDVTSFEIMEESLVSVPANTDAVTVEIILSLVEGGQLKSPVMREFGKSIRSHRNVSVPGIEIKYKERLGDKEREIVCGSFDQLKAAAEAGLIGGKENENKSRDGNEKGRGEEGADTAPKETDVTGNEDDSQDSSGAEVSKDTETPVDGVEEVKEDKSFDKGGPGSGRRPSGGSREGEGTSRADDVAIHADRLSQQAHRDSSISSHRNAASAHRDAAKLRREEGDERASKYHEHIAIMHDRVADVMTEDARKSVKSGRTLSKTNQQLITKAKEHVDDVAQNALNLHRSHGAQLREASTHLGSVLKTVADEDLNFASEGKPTMFTVETASAHIIAFASKNERKQLMSILKTIDGVDEKNAVVEQYEELVKGGPGSGRRPGGGVGGKPSEEHVNRANNASRSAEQASHEASKPNRRPEAQARLHREAARQHEVASRFHRENGKSDRANHHQAMAEHHANLGKIGKEFSNFDAKKKPLTTPEDNDEQNEPQQFDGDLHTEHHKGCTVLEGKEAHAYLLKCGLKCSGYKGNMVTVEGMQKQVAAHLVEKGWTHKYFTEDDDKSVHAFELKTEKGVKCMKSTTIYTTKEKSVGAVMLSKSE